MRKKYTLVLDIDNTLIVSSTRKWKEYDFYIDIPERYYIKTRPYLAKLLLFAHRYFNVVVFTAARKHYADSILDVIAPWITERYYRRDLIGELKYMTTIKSEKNLSNIIFVDDNEHHIRNFNSQNSLMIPFYSGNKTDSHLVELMGILTYYIK